MKNFIYLFLLLAIISCTKKNTSSQHQKEEQVFKNLKNLLKADNGKFWSENLYGPILLIDPETRTFVANQNNKSETFKKIGSIYIDTLPKELNIANTAINWQDERWTMVMNPLSDDNFTRNNLLIHELFHRLQPSIGFANLSEKSNDHLDTFEGRLLLKLELEALKKSLETEGSTQKNHLKNALTFRAIRQDNEAKKTAENSLEINEGLAEYTGLMLSGRNDKQIQKHLINSINDFYQNKTFVRSFAYQTIPVYGYLLTLEKENWQHNIDKDTNLTDYFIETFSLKLSEEKSYKSIAIDNNYNYQKIVDEEQERENKRLAKIQFYKEIFLQKPTLKLSFRNMNVSFDPRDIMPIEDIGTIYPNLRITDDWGILTVEKGALLSSDWSYVLVTQPSSIKDDLATGNGWKLELNDGWKVVKSGDIYTLESK